MSSLHFARPGEESRLMEIYRLCFPEDDPTFWKWIFEKLYRPENTLVVRKEGQIVASLQMIPCKMQLGERLFDAHYIYAASTCPEEQGKGLMGQLLEQAADEGRRCGQDFSVLITQEDSLLQYYARFGYQGRFCIAEMSPAEDGATLDNCCRPATVDDIPYLKALYEQATRGMLCGHRDTAHWKRQLELFGEGALVLEREGTIAAYAFSDERGVIEAVGPEAACLSAYAAPGCPWRTVPSEQAQPMGSIRPLHQQAAALVEQNPCFLNLMYN